MTQNPTAFPSYYASLAIAAIVIVVLIVVIRRLFFHPFSHVPGPFLAKITCAYSGFHSWRGTMHLDVQRCHQKYGDMIRYGPNQVLSLCPLDMARVYSHGKPFRKSKGYATMIPIPDGWSTMTSIDKTLHHNLRRTFRSGLTTDFLARYEPAILRNLEIYFDQLIRSEDTEGWSIANDMRKWNLYLGFDTMADFGLGIHTDLLRSPARDYVFPALHIHEKKMGLWEQMPVFNDLGIGNLISWLFPLISPKARQFASWYESFLKQALGNNTTEPRGIFGPVLQSGQGYLDKSGHGYSQMIGEGSFSTFSSADGYGMMISGFLHYLSHYPHVYEKLATEMRQKYRPGDKVVWNKALESSVYLRAVIDEVMRLLPPACGVHWRECEQQGVTVGENEMVLPVGSDIGVSLFCLFRDKRIFRDPVRFWPERWIQGTLPDAERRFAQSMFTPFLIGPRNCAGGHVAIMMASIAYTHILVNYDFRKGPEILKTSPYVWSNTPNEVGAEAELVFESHYSVAGWENGPFIQFKKRDMSS